MSIVGHPDWTPSLRGYSGALIYPVTNHTLLADTALPITLLPNQLYDVNVLNVLLLQDTEVELQVSSDIGSAIMGPRSFVSSGGSEVLAIPFRARGWTAVVNLRNYGPVQRIVTAAVRGYNGIAMAELMMPPQIFQAAFPTPAAGATIDLLTPSGGGMFDRCAWWISSDTACEVYLKVPWLQFPNVTHFAVLLGTLAAAGKLSGVFDIPGAGFTIQVKNTSAGVGGVTGACRLFRQGE